MCPDFHCLLIQILFYVFIFIFIFQGTQRIIIRDDKDEEDTAAAAGRRRFTTGAESVGDLKKMLKAESSNTMVGCWTTICRIGSSPF